LKSKGSQVVPWDTTGRCSTRSTQMFRRVVEDPLMHSALGRHTGPEMRTVAVEASRKAIADQMALRRLVPGRHPRPLRSNKPYPARNSSSCSTARCTCREQPGPGAALRPGHA